MKYYETHFDDYITSVENNNLHPELIDTFRKFPSKINKLENLIIYGPSGVGKYSQALCLLKKYSPSDLKYEKKILANTEKQQYTYRFSDIHYEIDMSLLGCNSKILWHEIFFQIVDIISVKQEKIGIIMCKNFHLIHTELLETFYSYMQQYNHSQSNIQIKFFLITEHISFLPTPIINVCQILNIGRPLKEKYLEMTMKNASNQLTLDTHEKRPFLNRISDYKIKSSRNTNKILDAIDLDGIMNIKDSRYFTLINELEELPNDVFNIICDNIITEIVSDKKINYTEFRDMLYDILTYNLDMVDCLWYILKYFIESGHLNENDISDVLVKTYTFLKYYNNNYLPIYHLESIIFYIVNKVRKYNEF
jgi:hypothetical protein